MVGFRRRLLRQIHLQLIQYYPLLEFRLAVSAHFEHSAIGRSH
jgi:hypothetical protein